MTNHRSLYIHKTVTTLTVVIGIFLFFSNTGFAQAQKKQTAVIENIKLANTRDALLTYFDVKNAFTEKISQAVLNGIPSTFSFYITLYQTDGSWFDKKIADIQVKSTLRYNPLKKEFVVQRMWKEEKPIITSSLITYLKE